MARRVSPPYDFFKTAISGLITVRKFEDGGGMVFDSKDWR